MTLNNPIFRKNITYSGGWFNDWWVIGRPYKGSNTHYTARLTAVPVYSGDGQDYLHLAISTRHIGSTDGMLRFTGKPESVVTTDYVDTGYFPASSATEVGLEVWANKGPLCFLTDWVHTTTRSATQDNPSFYGFYILGSWIITGEHHPYDRNVGYARRVLPERSYGAWEVAVRYSHLDLTSKAIDGGVLNRFSVIATWWATRRWQFSNAVGLGGPFTISDGGEFLRLYWGAFSGFTRSTEPK